ncbi:MAG: mechanosensitive ion channel [Luteolibacter sp.]
MNTTDLLAMNATEIAGTVQQWFDALGPIGKYIGALLIFLIGSAITKTIGKAVTKLSKGLDGKLSKYVSDSGGTISGLLGTLVRYVLLVMVIIFALDFAGMSQATRPLTDMLGKFFTYIPNIIGAAIVGYLFYFLANIVKTILMSVFGAAKIDERLGFVNGNAPLSKGISTAAFALILLVGIASSLTILKIEAISAPVQGVVDSLFSAVPYILFAAVLLAVGILVASLMKKFITNLLQGLGVDSYPQRIGLNIPAEGSKSVSSMVGILVFVSILVIMASSALKVLNIEMLADVADSLVPGYFNVLLSLLILGAGLMAARYVYSLLSGNNILLAKIARIAIIVIASVAALSRSGIAPDVTSAPYQAALSGLALALGLGGGIAFGLGGKDAVQRWLEKRGH